MTNSTDLLTAVSVVRQIAVGDAARASTRGRGFPTQSVGK
jgi:hypothetical protein